MTLPVQFGEWLPDQPALGNPGVTRAHNVLPGSGPFYKPFPSAQRYAATSMASRPYAAISVVDNLRNAHVFGAAKTQLMTLDPATQNWSDLSRTGGYTTADIEGWRFCEAYGLVVGTNYSDNPQYIDATKGAKFADLTTLVKARYVTTLRDFILVGNTYDPFDGPVPYRVRWSAVGNPFSWDFSATTQADFQDILGGGPVQAVIGGEEGTILLKSQIVKMIYVGSPAIFEFKTIYQNKGCAIPQSVISADGKIFFFGEDGFYMLENDKLTAIGKGKVDAWFKADANQSGFERMTVSVDPINKVVIWLYASVDSFDLTPDHMLVFNYDTGTWSTAVSPVTFLFNSLSLPTTLAALDRYGSLEAVPASLDSTVWSGGRAFLAAMDDKGVVYSFSGAPMPAIIETGDMPTAQMLAAASTKPITGDRALIRAVSPKVHGQGSLTVQIAGKITPQEATLYGNGSPVNVNGWCPLRSDARYHRLRLTLSGNWTQAMGVEIDAVATGTR